MNRSPEQLKRWAHEHLVYEAKMLVHSVERLADASLSTADHNAFVEAFAVHVRCLRDFLWRDSRPKNGPDDALASDFCAPGMWAKARPQEPEVLRQIHNRRRIGREIVHLTYARLGIDEEAKQWPAGELLRGIAGALACFVDIADRGLLDEKTRKALASLRPRLTQTEVPHAIHAGLFEVTGASHAVKPGPGTIAFPGYSEDDITSNSSI